MSAFEFMDSHSMVVAKENLKLKSPIGDFPFYVLIETSGSNGSHDEEKLSQFLEHVTSSEIVQDGTVATEPTKIQVWQLFIQNLKHPNIIIVISIV